MKELERPFLRVRLPRVKAPTEEALARRRQVVDAILKLREDIGPIGIPTDELVREVREEADRRG